jgi:1-acyl-sn-glycerol-3-phosphate acyltransferase
VVAIPTFVMPYRAIIAVAQNWARTSEWLMRVLCGISVEIRGREKIPKGAALVASKHQSIWETFALLPLFEDPAYILKRELRWIPFFGWYTWKGRMIPVDRGAGTQALAAMTERVKIEIAKGRQILIFPEGTRRAPGAEPRYKFGIAYLYTQSKMPCTPIALNSGLFWPRRSFLRYPGTILVEVLDPIKPGLDKSAFAATLQERIETATARLVAEGRAELAAHGIVRPQPAS